MSDVISSVEAGAGVAIATGAFSHAFGHRVKLLRLTPEPKPIVIGIAAAKGRLSPATEKFWQCAKEAASKKIVVYQFLRSPTREVVRNPPFGNVALGPDVLEGERYRDLSYSSQMTIMRNMKTFLSFLCGAAAMLGLSTLSGSNPSHHVYELRMYHVHEGKLDALKARFGDHTDAIFKRHNMKSIGYWVPEDAPRSQNLFVYILEHPSREEAKKNWAAFQADPEWQKVKAESEKNGPLLDKIDNYFMDPTSFSALQ